MNPSARKTFLCAILLAAVVAAVFGRSCWYPFLIWDDGQHITQNRAVNPPSVDGLVQIWKRPYFGLYIPLSYTFFAAESSISRKPLEEGIGSRPNPAVFHAGSLLLHIGCVLLVFFLLRKLFKHDLAALAGAMLFGLHPLQVESVAWVSETRGLLCALFSLAAIYLYLRAEPSRENWKPYALATLCFLLCSALVRNA